MKTEEITNSQDIIDSSDWLINYANKLRNPNYQREIESQGIEVRQLCEVN